MIRRRHRTCPLANLDLVGGNYEGNPGWAVTRSAVQWFKLQVGTDGLSYSAHGRIYDAAWSNPYWYHFPTLNVNAAGDLLVGFSGSRATEHIGAFWVGRKAGGQTTRPILIQAGKAYHARAVQGDPPDNVRWGDYIFTCADPDGTMFWTVQEYAEKDPSLPVRPNVPVANAWGTWIASLLLNPGDLEK